MKAIMTLDELESLWPKCAIEFMGHWLLLEQKYDRCLGRSRTQQGGEALVFLVKGFSETIARRSLANLDTMNVGVSILQPDTGGTWRDHAYSPHAGGWPVGPIAILDPVQTAMLQFESGPSSAHSC